MQSKNRKKFEEISKELRKNEEDILSKKNILSKEDFEKNVIDHQNKVSDLQRKKKKSNSKIIYLIVNCIYNKSKGVNYYYLSKKGFDSF